MTRDEFIDRYIERSNAHGRPDLTRTENGFITADGWARIALPCVCGEESCQGWAMVNDDPEHIAEHKRRNPVCAEDAQEVIIRKEVTEVWYGDTNPTLTTDAD